MNDLIGYIFGNTFSSWLWSQIGHYLRDGRFLGEDHPGPLEVRPRL